MRLYYFGNKDEIAGIERNGFTNRQDAYGRGDADCEISVLLTDRIKRYRSHPEAGVAVDCPEGIFLPNRLTTPFYELCAEDITQYCTVTRLTNRDFEQLQVRRP